MAEKLSDDQIEELLGKVQAHVTLGAGVPGVTRREALIALDSVRASRAEAGEPLRNIALAWLGTDCQDPAHQAIYEKCGRILLDHLDRRQPTPRLGCGEALVQVSSPEPATIATSHVHLFARSETAPPDSPEVCACGLQRYTVQLRASPDPATGAGHDPTRCAACLDEKHGFKPVTDHHGAVLKE